MPEIAWLRRFDEKPPEKTDEEESLQQIDYFNMLEELEFR